MNCQNKFCAYFDDEQCTLDEISIGMLGECLDCIYIDLDETLLDEERKHKRRELSIFED